MKNLLSIDNYAFYSALFIFSMYYIVAQGKKIERKSSGEKPKIEPIRVFKKSGDSLSNEQLIKIIKGNV